MSDSNPTEKFVSQIFIIRHDKFILESAEHIKSLIFSYVFFCRNTAFDVWHLCEEIQ